MLPFLFICEGCVVRAQLHRELSLTVKDTRLLMFERMRMVDMAHNWAESTLTGVSYCLRLFHKFLQHYDLPNHMVPTAPPHPPVHASILLYWNMCRHTLIETSWHNIKGFFTYNRAQAT